jgi:photosystem II stability/assembly factor-like uncharacterized protein
MIRLLRTQAVLLAFLALALPAAAGVGIWTPLGPDGGSIWNLVAAPSAPGVLYAGTGGGVFKTADGAQTWTLLRRELDGAFVLAVFDDAIYAYLGYRGVFKSPDGGQTWAAATDLPGGVFTLIADPRNPNRRWASGRAVHLSNDGGTTWQTLPKPKSKRPLSLTAFAVDPAGPWIYVATTRGFFRSADLGKTWQLGEGIRGGGALSQLAVDAGNPSILYASMSRDLLRSLDRGAHWKRVLTVPIGDFIADVLAPGDRVYLAVHGAGISYSSDHGNTWTRAAQGPIDLAALAAAPGVVYAGTYGHGRPGGVFRSSDRGVTWARPANKGLEALAVAAVAVDPSDPDVLYAGTFGSGLSRSVDRGATWKTVNLGIAPGEPVGILQVLVEPSRPSSVYAIDTDTWFFRSADGGETWQRSQLRGLNLFLSAIALDPRKPGALWGAGYPGVVHSDDGGAHWTEPSIPDADVTPYFDLLVDPRDPRVLYVAGFRGFSDPHPLHLFRSSDAGQTWQRRDSGIDGTTVLNLALDPANPSTLYAGTETGLYRSTDAGLTWARLPGIGGQVDEVVTAPTHPTTVYAVVAGFGIKRSTDGGATWSPVRSGLGGAPVVDLAVDPQDPDRLYAGTARGVLTYTDTGGN